MTIDIDWRFEIGELVRHRASGDRMIVQARSYRETAGGTGLYYTVASGPQQTTTVHDGEVVAESEYVPD